MAENTKLPITLVSVDCVNPQLALESLITTSEKLKFERIIIFSNRKPDLLPDNIEFVRIERLSDLIEYSNFILHILPRYISSEFCMIVHADGYVHNPHLWNDEFIKYDYIGAPWPNNYIEYNTRVGNGGVSIRSKKLMQLVANTGLANNHEDVLICAILKNYLEEQNCFIAPLELAGKFCVELQCDDVLINPSIDCFAFHGKKSDFHINKIAELEQKMKKRLESTSIIYSKFLLHKNSPSDINEHLDTLYNYACKCDTVAEFGVRNVVSSYALAHAKPKKLLCLDIVTNNNVKLFIEECRAENVNMEFVEASSLDYELPEAVDMLFIDTLHSYNQLFAELEKHHSKVNRYIIFHDTIFWGYKNEDPVTGSDTGEIGDKVGLVPAIRDFLRENSNWKEVCTYTNNNGLTIIENKNYSSHR